MLVADIHKIPVLASLAVIIFLLGGGVVLSVIFPERAKLSFKWPAVGVFQRLYTVTHAQAKKIVILIIGVTILTFVVLELVIPEPDDFVLPIGIVVLLAVIFWAKHFLSNSTSH